MDVRYAFFCEDIRNEQGGQVTAIGLWGGRCVVPGFPATIRSLAFHAHVHNPQQTAAEFEFRLDAPFDVPPEELQFRAPLPNAEGKVGTNLNAVFGGFTVERPCTLTMHLRIFSSPPIEHIYTLDVVQRAGA